jgi:Lon protease-like protein
MALLPQILHSPHPRLAAASPSPYPSSSRAFRRAPRLRALALRRFVAAAAAGPSGPPEPSSYPPESDDGLVELPLFPLPLVLFPDATHALHIFEFRYRIMMHTVLQTDLRFGVVFAGSGSGGAANVGCLGEVVKHERLADDRFFLICKGQQRFRVARVVRTKPYLVAAVQWLEDRPPAEPPAPGEDAEALATDVEALMRDVIRIANRLNGKPEKEVGDLRKGLFPTPFSFYVGNTFEGAPREQQALLELEDTAARLGRERDTLRNTLNYLTAASAVKDAFPSSPSSG